MKKVIFLVCGILLIGAGGYMLYDGYQLKQTTAAKVEKSVSDTIRAITDNSVKMDDSLNRKYKMEMIGGGAILLAGLLALGTGLQTKK